MAGLDKRPDPAGSLVLAAEPATTSRVMGLLLAAVFLDLLSVGLVVPLLPYYAATLGASSATIGLLGSFYGLLQLLGSPVMGWLADRYGRKSTLCLSFLGTIVSYMSLPMATTLPLLFVTRIPVGMMKQTMSIAQAIVSDTSSKSDRTRFLGYVSTAVGLGFIAGPALGGVISTYGLQYPAYVSCALLTADMLMVVWLMPDTWSAVPQSSAASSTTVPATVVPANQPSGFIERILWVVQNASSGVLFVYMLHFLATLAETIGKSTFQQFTIKRYALSPSENGYVTSYMSFLQVLVQGLVIGPLNRRFSDGQLISWGTVCHSLAALLLMRSMGIYGAMAAIVPLIWGSGIVSTCITSTATKIVSIHELGTTLGVLGSIGSVVHVLAPYLGGLLMDSALGVSAPSGLVAMLAALIFIFLQAVQLPIGEVQVVAGMDGV